MNYSTLAEGFAQDADGIIFDLGSLYQRLCGLNDSRKRRGRRYELALILMGVLLAKLAGENKPEGIAGWVQLRSAFFVDVFQLKRAALPCPMTYRRVLAEAVTIHELDCLTREYLLSWLGAGQSVQSRSMVRRRAECWRPIKRGPFICWRLICHVRASC
jgi:hypothetical protein